MNLIPLPAFQDNYLCVLHDGHPALIVDPGAAQPVLHCLQRDGLQLEAILVTHHHPGHIGGAGTSPEFAQAGEPGKLELINHKRHCEALCSRNLPALPSIEQEWRIDPFLRSRLPGVVQAAHDFPGATAEDDAAVFAATRHWKNEFK